MYYEKGTAGGAWMKIELVLVHPVVHHIISTNHVGMIVGENVFISAVLPGYD